ncbi:MAG: hypothetical protein WA051_02345 [Minisyncoccia bacterium]
MKKLITGALGFALPAVALAQTAPNLNYVEQLLSSISRLVNTALPVIVAVALLFFFYGLAKFILASGGDDDAKKAGKHIMVWGIVALFVMVSVWGLVAFLGQALGIQQGQSLPNVPSVNQVR